MMLRQSKKSVWLAVVGVATTAVSVFGARGVWEYTQVAHANVKAAVQDAVPIGLEIQRLELVVNKLDQTIATDQREVAKAAVALERAEQELAASDAALQGEMKKMTELRRLLNGRETQIRAGCSLYQRGEVEQALRHKLDEYRAGRQTATQRSESVQKQRDAFRRLSGRVAERQHERTLLQQKVATLKAQHQAVRLAKGQSLDAFDETSLAHAREIAKRIEDRLQVEEKLSRLDVDSLPLATAAGEVRDAAREFDELVGAGDSGDEPAATPSARD